MLRMPHLLQLFSICHQIFCCVCDHGCRNKGPHCKINVCMCNFLLNNYQSSLHFKILMKWRGGKLKWSVLSHIGFPSQVVLTQNIGNYFEFCQEKVSVPCFNNSTDTENNILCFFCLLWSTWHKYEPKMTFWI